MSYAGNASIVFYPDHVSLEWRIAPGNDDEIQLRGRAREFGELVFLADPAIVLRELDAARQLVIDHLVETVGIPATVLAERELLADILREVGADLPSPLSARIRSTLAGDHPETTGRTTVAALTDRRADVLPLERYACDDPTCSPVEPCAQHEHRKAVDLMEALENSVAAAKDARRRHPQPSSAGGA